MVPLTGINHNNSLNFIMKVKIDTREKFHVISFEEAAITANMTASLRDLATQFLDKDPKNLILNFKETELIDHEILEELTSLHQLFYEQSASFVVCELPETVRKNELAEQLNATPTESEAWDIVQMEEIERELFNDDSSY